MKQMRNVRAEIVSLIKTVCLKLTGHANDNEVKLLLGTAAAESGLIFRKQLDDGPARGLWQMEPTTAYDIFQNYLAWRRPLWLDVREIWLEVRSMPSSHPLWVPMRTELEYHLEKCDDFACAMARIHYLRDPHPIPDALEGQAAYWKKVYNTPAGAGTVEHYMARWEACGCEDLLAGNH